MSAVCSRSYVESKTINYSCRNKSCPGTIGVEHDLVRATVTVCLVLLLEWVLIANTSGQSDSELYEY